MAAIATQLQRVRRGRDPFLSGWYAARDGASDACIVFLGDSNTSGYSDPKNLSTSSQLAALMTKGNPSLGSFLADNNQPSFSTYDPRLTIGSGWGIDRGFPAAIAGGYWLSNGGAGTLDFNPGSIDFDIVDALFGSYTGGPSLALTRDGGTAVGSVNMGETSGSLLLRSFNMPLGTHTLSLSGGTSGGYLSGMRVRKSAEKRTHFMNAGYYGVSTGSQINTGTDDAFNVLAAIAAIIPSLVVVMLGTNDLEGGVTNATYIANMIAIITAVRATGANVMVLGPQYGITSTYGSEAVQDGYFNPLIKVASDLGCAYYSIRSRAGWRTFAEANASGFMNGDGVHLTSKGRGDQAFALKQILDA